MERYSGGLKAKSTLDSQVDQGCSSSGNFLSAPGQRGATGPGDTIADKYDKAREIPGLVGERVVLVSVSSKCQRRFRERTVTVATMAAGNNFGSSIHCSPTPVIQTGVDR